MKALEKAAKDREGGDAPTAKDGLSLEPMPAQAAAAKTTMPAPAAPASPASRSAAATTTPATGARQPEQAATVISAARSSGGGAGAFLRDRPLAVFGTLAGLAIAGYGGYVYLQLTNPGLFANNPPPVAPIAATAKPATPPPAPAAPAQASETLSPLTLADTDAAKAADTSATTAASTTKPAANTPGSGNAPTAAAASTATVAAAASTKTNAAPTAAATPAAAAPLPQAAIVPAREAARDSIKITPGSTSTAINPLLTEAYGALNAGKFDTAQRLYEQTLRSDPGNIDALLGLGAIASQQGNNDEATRRYLKVLELEPRNAAAQAGLIGILGRADPQAAETRIKQLIGREPSTAFLQFALGIAYIDQKRWPDAQQAFFQAHQLQPDNPDYAYNLAVALEHIGQPKAALDFYRRAVQLATAKGRADFSVTAAEERIGKLEKAFR